MRLGLLMRRMTLDWTLSRRQRVDFGAPPQTWEQYSKEGRIWDLYIDRTDCGTRGRVQGAYYPRDLKYSLKEFGDRSCIRP